jgi:hypothetical protein
MIQILLATVVAVVGLVWGQPYVAGAGMLWMAWLAHKAFPLGTRPPRAAIPSTTEELRQMVEGDLERARRLLWHGSDSPPDPPARP